VSISSFTAADGNRMDVMKRVNNYDSVWHTLLNFSRILIFKNMIKQFYFWLC